MSFAVDIPPISCLLRREYLYNLEEHHGETEPCLVIAADSIESRAVGFDVLLQNGALFSRLPISALCWKTPSPNNRLEHLQPWGCFSYDFEAHAYSALRECSVLARIGSVQIVGQYLFTFSWKGSVYAESAEHFKRGHVVRLLDGGFAILPNNYLCWEDKSWVTKSYAAAKPDYRTNKNDWYCECGV